MASFKFEKISTFTNTVRVMRPDGVEQEFKASFVYLDDEAWTKIGAEPTGDFLRKHWTGWEDIVGADDKPMPFSEAQRDQLLAHSYITQAVLASYIAGRQGQRAKN